MTTAGKARDETFAKELPDADVLHMRDRDDVFVGREPFADEGRDVLDDEII